jgi:hypothetical protein
MMLHFTRRILLVRVVDGGFCDELGPFVGKFGVCECPSLPPMCALTLIETGRIVYSFPVSEFAGHLFKGTVLDVPDLESVDRFAGHMVNTVVSHVDVRVGDGTKHDFGVWLRVWAPPSELSVRIRVVGHVDTG